MINFILNIIDYIGTLFRKHEEISATPLQPQNAPAQPITLLPRERLYLMAKLCLEQNLVPPGDDPELGCAISVNIVHQRAFGDQIGGGTSTYQLYQALKTRQDFQEVDTPLPGDIIISPTGTQGPMSPLSNGHVGIVAKFGILSNNSYTSKFDEHYTLLSWSQHYKVLGKFPIYFFRKI